MQASDRLGGHIVQGHVDGVGEVARGRRGRLRPPPARRPRPGAAALRRSSRGSIALSGVSLTVAALGEDWVEVSLIPETLERTNLGELPPGTRVNVECDVVAKYVERLVSPFSGKEQA